MLEGEMSSLLSVHSTGCVRVPLPEAVLDRPGRDGGAILVMEYLDLRSVGGKAKQMGKAIARYKVCTRCRSKYYF